MQVGRREEVQGGGGEEVQQGERKVQEGDVKRRKRRRCTVEERRCGEMEVEDEGRCRERQECVRFQEMEEVQGEYSRAGGGTVKAGVLRVRP